LALHSVAIFVGRAQAVEDVAEVYAGPGLGREKSGIHIRFPRLAGARGFMFFFMYFFINKVGGSLGTSESVFRDL
jgi:hypothetical protein